MSKLTCDNPNSISRSFCSLAWTQIHVTPTGVVKPCCIYDGFLKKENNEALRIVDGELKDIWNSEPFKNLRKKMLQGESVPECIKCYEEERTYLTSDRLRSFISNRTLLESIEHSRDKDGFVSELPNILNLKIGNTCNLKCRMCQPLDSCMVDLEFRQISKINANFRNFDNASAFDYNYDQQSLEIAVNWIKDPVANENLKKLLVNTCHISLAGGEIAFTKEALDFLKFCVETGVSKNIDIVLSSNLTSVSDEFIKLLSSFRLATVVASIDGRQNLLEYIRYPSKWNIVYDNFVKLIKAPGNIIPVLAPTVQIYNVLDIVDVLQIVEDLKSEKWERQFSPCHLTILFSPQHLSIRHLPKKIKKLAYDRLLAFSEKSYYIKKHSIYSDQINLLLHTLNQDNYELIDGLKSETYLSHFLQYTHDLDQNRHQRMKDFIPELYCLLLDEGLTPSYPKQGVRSYSFYKYRDAGFKLQEKGQFAEAIDMLNSAYGLDKKDPDLLFSLGVCYKMTNNTAAAESFFLQVYEIKPEHYYNLIELAFAEKNKNNFKKAIFYFEKSKKHESAERNSFANPFIQECLARLNN